MFEIFRGWNKLDLVNKVLYRHILFLIGEDVRRPVLPLHFQSHCDVLKQQHNDGVPQGRDRTLSLVCKRFYWPDLDSDMEAKVKNCIPLY